MNKEEFIKLKHDLRSDLTAIFEASKILSKMEEVPSAALEVLTLINQKNNKSMNDLESLFIQLEIFYRES